MITQGIVIQPGQGPVATYSPGRSSILKLQCDETEGSIMMFEATAPIGAKSTLHLHRDSDEVAYVLAGEVTFSIGGQITVGHPGSCIFMPRGVPHAWKNSGAETGRALFLYTPATAGGFFEDMAKRPAGALSEEERIELRTNDAPVLLQCRDERKPRRLVVHRRHLGRYILPRLAQQRGGRTLAAELPLP